MDAETRYQKALDYLYSFVDFSMTRALRYSPEKFHLERMIMLADSCGNPHKSYPVIHIAGTKGKGSTAAMITSCLMAAGYRVGLYTSPHLSEFTERIQVNGREIEKGNLADLVDCLKPHIARIPELTTFELTTMLGFLYFQQQGIDIAVVEVGLGGRLDSTNIVTPLVSVITSLSMDHMSVLGDSLEKIAFEKAGIIKPGKPVVLSPQKPEARKIVVDICKERHSQIIEIGKQVQFSPLKHSLSGQTFTVWSEENAEPEDSHQYPLQLTIPLLGYHQVENAATAYGALEVVRKSGLTLSIADYVQGFKNVIWPGRFEVLRVNPPIIIDSAHNRDSALKLANALNDYLPDIPIVLVFGASEDKDVEGMFTELLPRINLVIATQSIHPRALDAETIKTIAENHQMEAMVIKDVTAAFEEALLSAGDSTAVVVTGSLFIAAAIRDHWMKKISTNI